MAPNDLVKVVRDHAIEHYEKDGWDYVVECWSDEEILKAIGKARTEAGAIAKMRAEIKPLAEYRDEIRAEIF